MKQALIEARKHVHDHSSHDTYNNTYAIIFFGTPHRGSNLAYWGRLLSGVAQATQMDTHDGILRDLDPKSNSSKLRELNLDFDDILCDHQKARELRVFSFQEALGMTGVNFLGGKVSPPSRAMFSVPRLDMFSRGGQSGQRETSNQSQGLSSLDRLKAYCSV